MAAIWTCIKNSLAGSRIEDVRVSEGNIVSMYPACGLCPGSSQVPVTEGISMNGTSGFVLGLEHALQAQALRGTPLLPGYGAPEQDRMTRGDREEVSDRASGGGQDSGGELYAKHVAWRSRGQAEGCVAVGVWREAVLGYLGVGVVWVVW